MTIFEFYTKVMRVARYELNRAITRPVYIFSTIVVMLFSCIFFLTLFKTGAPEKMPIAIVDLDQSSISRRVAHELNATQSVTITNVYSSYQEARIAMQQGKIYAFLLIPSHFYSDLAAFKRPTLTFYVNNAYTVGASTSYKQLLMVMNLASGAFQREVLRKKGLPEHLLMKRIQPVAIDAHLIGNPMSNYSVYLLGVILPGMLGVIVLMITIYSIGGELKWKTSHEWLKQAEGNYVVAMIGKMLPHTALYCMMGITVNIIMFRILEFPVNGSFLYLNLGLITYIFAIQSMAVTFIGLVPVLRDALSIGALYGMLSFSLSGFTFPYMGMLTWMKPLCYLFPLRHYYLIYVNEALLGGPIIQSALFVGMLLSFCVLQFLVGHRLHNALVYQNYPRD